MIIFVPKAFSPLVLGGILFMALMATACSTTSQQISEDLSAEELVQRAQEASDRNRYTTALRFYETLRERNPTNIDWICTAEYEIAFIHYKQKKYDEARGELNALLLRYESPDAELLPQQFKRLSGIVLESIGEKETRRNRFFSPQQPRDSQPSAAAPDSTGEE
jgi:tetratricopeptide (TPR) repeat protein